MYFCAPFIYMNIAEKSKAVLNVFKELESETKQFVAESELSCLLGCGFCCSNPKIPACTLEFIPMAFELYSKGKAEQILLELEHNEDLNECIIYRPQSEDGKKGFCGNHSHRGLICRLFSASARKNKYGAKELIMCKVIKGEKPTQYEVVSKRINEDLEIPLATSFYSRLEEIDSALCKQQTVNEALRDALELVLRYQFYQEEDFSIGV